MRREGGLLQEMLDKCNDRMVCFDNRTKDETIRNKQVRCLLDMVNKMKQLHRYTTETFKNFQKSQEVSILEKRKPFIREATEKLIKSMMQELDIIPANPLDIEKLEKNVTKLQEYRQELIEKDKGTGVLMDFISMVSKEEGYMTAKVEDFRMTLAENKMDMANSEGKLDKTLQPDKTGDGESFTANTIMGQKKAADQKAKWEEEERVRRKEAEERAKSEAVERTKYEEQRAKKKERARIEEQERHRIEEEEDFARRQEEEERARMEEIIRIRWEEEEEERARIEEEQERHRIEEEEDFVRRQEEQESAGRNEDHWVTLWG